jgi:hypothetical protein
MNETVILTGVIYLSLKRKTMNQYHIKISYYDSHSQENEERLIETAYNIPLICTLEQGKKNLQFIKENVELEKKIWGSSWLKSTADCVEVLPQYEDKEWFTFPKFVCLVDENGRYEGAASDWQISQGLPTKEFYHPDFYYIKLLQENGELVSCESFWNTNYNGSNYSAELVAVFETTDTKITW